MIFRMTSSVLCAVLLLCLLEFGATQKKSCKGRCGGEYLRGSVCQCDYSCLVYGECCKDYESKCTTKNSCKGRCGEPFKRGRLCSCDNECIKYGQCCPDFELHCDTEELTMTTPELSSMYSEANNADDPSASLNSPTSNPADEISDDPLSSILPTEYFPNNAVENAEASVVPLAQVSTEPTTAAHAVELPTEAVTVFSQAETTPSDDTKLFTVELTTAAAETAAAEATAAEAITAAETAEVAAEAAEATAAAEAEATAAAAAAEATAAAETAAAEAEATAEATAAAAAAAAAETAAAETAAAEAAAEATAAEATAAAEAEATAATAAEATAAAADTAAAEAAAEATAEAEAAAAEAAEATATAAAEAEAEATVAAPAADNEATQPASPSEPQTELTTLSSTPVGEAVGEMEPQPAGASFPSDEPEVPTVLSSTQDSATDLENPQATTTANAAPPSSTPNLTPVPEKSTPNPNTESNSGDGPTVSPTLPAGPEGPFTTVVSPDAVTSHISTKPAAAQDGTTDDVTPSVNTAAPQKVTSEPDNPQSAKPTLKPQDSKPDPEKPPPVKPTFKPRKPKPQDTTQTPSKDDPKDYQADDSKDTNLCNGQPISGATTLRNGTIVVFRGQYFWLLDSNRVPGPARGITQVWGVPSPIDTVFTRCNCQGKTYIFKGGRYWRFDNDVLDPGYPRAVQTGFDGLQGHVTAALSVPQHERRGESVYFFKRGGSVQKYSYQFGTSPSCGRKVQYAVYTVRKRLARQAVSVLGPTINIQTSWRGFPSTITAAVSIPSSSEQEGYKYYVFSRSKSYQVRMDSERPVISPPTDNTPSHSNNVFKCPKKVQTV